MFPSTRSAARLALVVLVFAAISPAVSVLKPVGTPYQSALSILGPSTAIAAPGCSMQICDKPKGSKPADCLATSLSYNCSKSGGHCTSTAC
jgi:hypothetical protein